MSVLPSGVAASREITLVWPSSRATGFGTSPPTLSGSSHRRISPRLLPAATRRDEPKKVTAVTQSASHWRFQACAGFVRSGMGSSQLPLAASRACVPYEAARGLPQQRVHRLRPFGRQPDGAHAVVVLRAVVDAE